ncbi:MAG: hypothetical protein AVDCRST_MAG49-2733 [uncultured Thermomicrobiales bacterium]|uniref:Uncharacterized protein n=1 Tax=uncultured Thermomicrobiales bacterium TaxID=1645740 RepID=A0A6J4V2V8_9BACT|nr:MAG: hypothetical protein AVDCRST_MAG49-2733 [uncultured Thermomicrobiales bacterium]
MDAAASEVATISPGKARRLLRLPVVGHRLLGRTSPRPGRVLGTRRHRPAPPRR